MMNGTILTPVCEVLRRAGFFGVRSGSSEDLRDRRRGRVKSSMRWMLLQISLAFCFLASLPRLQAQSPATQPTTQPSDELAASSPIRGWFRQLADPDPKIRDRAKTDLMGISADDLPRLRQLVIESQPLSPAQSGALYDIVIQSYLANQPYRVWGNTYANASGTGNPYFLGIVWTAEIVDNEPPRRGAIIEDRLPGFPSYRFLRTGDMILGVYIHPDRPLKELPNMETHTRIALKTALSNQLEGRDFVLEVLRDGETIRVPVTLAPRPIDADTLAPGAVQAFNAIRVDSAEAYFNENFAPLVDQNIEASNLAEGP
jgi:hypothetical protein